MSSGFLKFQIHTGDDALPVEGAAITVFYPNGKIIYRTKSDKNGDTPAYSLPCPNKENTLDPHAKKPAVSLYNADISAPGYIVKHIQNIPIVDKQTTIMPENMQPITDEAIKITDEYIEIAPNSLTIPVKNRQNQAPAEVLPDTSAQPIAVMAAMDPPAQGLMNSGVTIPEYITVHLGIPTNSSARNVRVRFSDYIKNVTSSEIYSTWPNSSLEANIHAIVTFALNRIYTEWYRSRGYNFDITNSTSYDMSYRDGGPVFENISRIVDDLFSTYARRIGFEDPFFTQFCNGTTSTCNGLSQWGTVTLANQGKSPLEILRYYYPKDLELTISNNIGGITESYPGYALKIGSTGESVRRMQDFLNRIRVNYPLIPQITNPNGVFGNDTADAVRTFQRTFNMTADGVIGRDTWNKITFIFNAVARLAELDSEGIRVTIGQNPPTAVLSIGSRGKDVIELQFLLNYIAVFFPSVPTVIQDSVFDAQTKNAVTEFQKSFGLTPDGIVGPATWNKLYAVYKGIDETVPDSGAPSPVPPLPGNNAPPYPGLPLKRGATGEDVKTMQAYLNVINTIYPSVPQLTVDGTFGPKTEEAVKAFQTLNFLTSDGIIGPVTWDKIVQMYLLASGNQEVSLVYPGEPLKVGSRGSGVRLMQEFISEIRSLFPSLPAITVDGIFGPNTEAAVRMFQSLFGLTVDGIIGRNTWYEIIRQHNRLM